MTQIPFTDFGGTGTVVHFSHANGFHPKAYTQLLMPFTEDYRVIGIHHRPFWEKSVVNSVKNWHDFADDQIRFLEQQKAKKVIGIGHSLGASVTLLSAIKRPDLYDKLVLIEPVLLPRFVFWLLDFLPFSLKKKVSPPAKISIKRTDTWDNRQAAYDYLRPKKVFSKIPDPIFRDFLGAALKENDAKQAILSFSKEWETHIYAAITNLWHLLPKISQPTLAIRGDTTDTITLDSWKKWQNMQLKSTVFKNIPQYGHLVPLEASDLLADLIGDFLGN